MTAETKAGKQTEESSEIIRAVKPALRPRKRNSAVASESLKTSSVCVCVCRPAAARLNDSRAPGERRRGKGITRTALKYQRCE